MSNVPQMKDEIETDTMLLMNNDAAAITKAARKGKIMSYFFSALSSWLLYPLPFHTRHRKLQDSAKINEIKSDITQRRSYFDY